jgi:2'-5' RNA ligase
VRATLAAGAAEVVGGVPGVRLLGPRSLHLTLCFLGEIELEQVPALAAAIREVVGSVRAGAGGVGGAGAGAAEAGAAGAGDPPIASAGAGVGAEVGAGERMQGRTGERIVLAPAEALALPTRRPRVLALGLRDIDGRGAALQAALAARLQAGGWYAPEGRPWLPHITLARAGRAGGAGRAGRPAEAGRAAGSAAGSVQESDLGALASAGLPPVELQPFTPEAVALLRSWPGSRYEPLARTAL